MMCQRACLPLGLQAGLLLACFVAACSENVPAGGNVGPELTPSAAPAAPDMSSVSQPDGTVIKVYLKGDEWRNWVETVGGYTIAKGEDGYWYYVSQGEGSLAAENHSLGIKLTNVYAHELPPPGLPKHIRPLTRGQKGESK